MESSHAKETLSLLGRVPIFAIHNEGDERLQHPVEGIINLVEGITIRLKKQTSIYFFLIVKLFFSHRPDKSYDCTSLISISCLPR